MRSFKDFLLEMPARSLDFVGNWTDHFDIYSSDAGYYDKATLKNIKKSVPKILKYFDKIEQDFIFYMARDKELPDLTSGEEGRVHDPSKHPVTTRYGIQPTEDAITVVFVGNAAENLIPIHKPGNFAHRLSHALAFDSKLRNTPYQGMSPPYSSIYDSIVSMLEDADYKAQLITSQERRNKRDDLLQFRFGPGAQNRGIVNGYLRAIAPEFNASKSRKGYTTGYEFAHEAFANYVKNGEMVKLSDFDHIMIDPLRKENMDQEEIYAMMDDFWTYPTGEDGEPDYDQEGEFDEEAFEASFREPRKFAHESYKEFGSSGYSKTFELYINDALNSAVGEVFLM